MKKIRFFIFEKSYSKKLGFVLRTDKAFNSIFSFVKERRLNFSLPERKVTKEAGKPFAWPACAHGKCTQQSQLDSARTPALTTHEISNEWKLKYTAPKQCRPKAQYGSLGARVLRRSLFFEELWSNLLRCTDRTSAPPTAYFSPAGCCENFPVFAVLRNFRCHPCKSPLGAKSWCGNVRRFVEAPTCSHTSESSHESWNALPHKVAFRGSRDEAPTRTRAIKSKPFVREPTISNLLALRTTEAEFWGTAIPGTVNVFATQLMVRQALKPPRLVCFFCNFSFKQRKVWPFLLFQKDLSKSPVWTQRKAQRKNSFYS